MKRLITILFLFFVLYSLIFIHPASAQENSAFSLGVYPPVIEIATNPPSPLDSTITIQNQSDLVQKLSIQLKPFKENTDGSITYLGDDEIQAPYKDLFNRIKFLDSDNEVKDIELKPFEEKNITVSYDLDKSSTRGEYYFSIIFMSENTSKLDNSGSAIPGGIATNVLLTVGEKGPSAGKIIELSAPGFLSKGPVPITLLFKNQSGHFITPTGRVSIYDMFGKEIGRADLLPQYILPDSNRYLIDENQASPSAELIQDIEKLKTDHPIIIWPEKFLFGIYTIKAVVKTSSDTNLIQAQTRLVALPLYMFFALSLFIFILAGVWLKVKNKV